MVVTVRIISNVFSHSSISVGAVTFRNIGKSGPVNPELVSDMAEASATRQLKTENLCLTPAEAQFFLKINISLVLVGMGSSAEYCLGINVKYFGQADTYNLQ